jgi:hypothetical protein
MDKQFCLLPEFRSVLYGRIDCQSEILGFHSGAVEDKSCVMLRCAVGKRATHINKGRVSFETSKTVVSNTASHPSGHRYLLADKSLTRPGRKQATRMYKSSWMMEPTRWCEMPSCSGTDLAEIRWSSKISSWIWSIISGVVGLRTYQHPGHTKYCKVKHSTAWNFIASNAILGCFYSCWTDKSWPDAPVRFH